MATRILLDPRQDLADATLGPAPVLVEATPTGIREDGSIVILPTTVSFVVNTAADIVELLTPDASWAWTIEVRRIVGQIRVIGQGVQGGSVLTRRTVTWTDTPQIAWADLTDLDPATLQPTTDVVASWVATQALAQQVKASLDALVAGAPSALDTFLEVATQLASDESGAATLAALIGTKAPLVSPALTGTPTAPTAATSDSSTQLATTALVAAKVAALGTSVAATYLTQTAGVPVLDYSTSALPKWTAALSKARQGTAFAKLLCVGDSTTAGFGATQATSWPALVMQRLNLLLPSQPGLSIAMASGVDSARWALGGWSLNFGPAGAALYAEPGAGSDAVFTPGVNVDTIDIWWMQAAGKGTFVPKIDGAAQTAINTLGGSGHWQKTTYTVAAGTGHTVALQMPTVGPVDILGIDAYLSTANGVRVANWGVVGSVSDSWVTFPYSIGAISDYAPDLTLIMLGINDANTGVSAATWAANVNAIIDEAQKTGDVMVFSVVPSAPANAAQLAAEQAYRAQLAGIAAAQDVPVLDIFGKVGAYSAALYSDSVHPNAYGYANIARYVMAALQAA